MVRYIWAPYRALELALLERYSEKYSAWATAAESTDREVVHLISTMVMMVMMNSITETSKHPTKTSTKSIVISVFVESHKNIQYNNQLKQFTMSFIISVTSHKKNTGRPYLQLGTSQAN